jgi:predicted RNA binding protein YcfA (HicA-like mRNA interferase family)
MGKRRYPPLKNREVVAILTALGFFLVRQESSHAQYERLAEYDAATKEMIRRRAIVTVDNYPDFEEKMIKNLISQAGFSRDEFYGATKSTAAKIR